MLPRLPLLLCALSCCASPPLRSDPQAGAERVLLLRADTNAIPLFPEELDALRGLGFEFLSRQSGFQPVPLEELDALERTSAEGRSRPGGPVCRAPTPLWILMKQEYPGVPQARLTASCYTRPCELTLRISRPPQKDGPYAQLASWEATVEGAGDLAAWKAAVARLAVPPPPEGGVGGLSLSEGHDEPSRVLVTRIYPTGSWSRTPAPADLRAVQPQLDSCHETGWSSAGEDEAVLEISGPGAVSRCHLVPKHEPARPERLDCLCRALSAVRFEAGADARRLLVYLINEPLSEVKTQTSRIGARFEHVVVSDGTELRGQLGSDSFALAQCYAATTPSGIQRLALHLEMDAVGNVTAAAFKGGTAELAACLEKIVRGTALPCSKTGSSVSAEASLVLYAAP